jgi:hypothetical protein
MSQLLDEEITGTHDRSYQQYCHQREKLNVHGILDDANKIENSGK